MSSIYYSGSISKKEYSSAIRAHFNQQLKWVKMVFGVILSILVLALIVTFLQYPSILQYFFPGMLFPFIILTFPWWTPLLQASSYDKKGNIYRKPIHGVIDETEIIISGEETMSKFLWNAFSSYKKVDDLILVYQGKNQMNIFSKKLFGTEEEWKQFEDLLKSKLSSQHS